jgi:UMF1 family MFS transporter
MAESSRLILGPMSLLSKLGLGRREVRAWAMYDWANSAFWSTVITAVFPEFFSSVAAAGLPPGVATARFATITTAALVVIAILSPILGAIADYAGIRKRMLGGFLAMGASATAAMALIGEGDWVFAATLFMLANIGVTGTIVFYDSLLPFVARQDELDRVSASAYAVGFLGGGLLLAVNLAWIVQPGWFGLPNAVAGIHLSFLSVAVWWVAFSIPLFRHVPEPPREIRAGEAQQNAVVAAFARIGGTFRELRRYRNACLMLVAFMLYNDGIQTIIRLATVYGAEIGIGRDSLIAAILLVQFAGIPFTFLFGLMAGRLGTVRSIYIALTVYAIMCVFAYQMTTATEFFVLAIAVAMVQGGSQALSRSLFASLIPRQAASQFFGFFSVFEKFAGIFGPAIFAVVATATGSGRGAILSVIGFFVVGGSLLAFVNVAEGQRIAREAERTAEVV